MRYLTLKQYIKKILTFLLAALGIYFLTAGVRAGIGITRIYDGQIPIWFCILPYAVGLFLIILIITAIHKNTNRKINTILLSALAALILISGIAEAVNIPDDYRSGIIPFYILPYIIELLVLLFTYVALRKKNNNKMKKRDEK